MGLRDKLRRLERGARGNLSSFVLEDGTRHYFNPESGECFLHGCECLRAGSDGESFPERATRDDKDPHKGTQQGRRPGGNLWWWIGSVPI
jgi:hypothetical protein